jgi:phage shock protein A
VIDRCNEAQQQLLGHLQALCTKGEHVKDLSTKVKALKADVQSLLTLMQAYMQKHPHAYVDAV